MSTNVLIVVFLFMNTLHVRRLCVSGSPTDKATKTIFEGFMCHERHQDPQKEHQEFFKVIKACTSNTSLAIECQNYCIADNLKLIVDGKLNVPATLTLLRPEFATDERTEEFVKMVKKLRKCSEFSQELLKPCENQTIFWDCCNEALSC